jgi:hypothetical protein
MTKIKKDNDQEFFRKIERKFSQLREGPLLISPKDWALMVEWKKQGIPAVVIIEALEKGFESAAFRGTSRKSINSLHYFKRIVEEHWHSFQKRKIGKAEKESPDPACSEIKEYLEDLSRFLEERSLTFSSETALSKILKEASQRIQLLKEKNVDAQDSIELLEEELSLIDEKIDKRLLDHVSQESIDALLRDAECELSSMGHYMKEEHYSDIKKRYLLKKLRKKYGIPRVSLFFQ